MAGTIKLSEDKIRAFDEILLGVGDVFSIAGVCAPDRRTRWQRFKDWAFRRPPPTTKLQLFRVTSVTTWRPTPYITRSNDE